MRLMVTFGVFLDQCIIRRWISDGNECRVHLYIFVYVKKNYFITLALNLLCSTSKDSGEPFMMGAYEEVAGIPFRFTIC